MGAEAETWKKIDNCHSIPSNFMASLINMLPFFSGVLNNKKVI